MWKAGGHGLRGLFLGDWEFQGGFARTYTKIC